MSKKISNTKNATDGIVTLSTDEIRDRILNEHNKSITAKFINGIFKKLGFNHTVKNLDNFQQAMVHVSYLEDNITNQKTIKLLKDVIPIDKSFRDKCMPLQKKSYERLEFLGDSVIRHSIGKYLFTRYPDEDEGFLTRNRSKMENKEALSNLARRIGIQNYAVISRNIEQVNGRTTLPNITEDIFEAFIGALNLEVSDDMSVEFMWKLIEYELDMAETIRTQNNYKDMLMQYFHKVDNTRRDLVYEDQDIDVNGKKRYHTIVYEKDSHKQLGSGIGRSKKHSQQNAAKDALLQLNVIANEISENEYYEYNGNVDAELQHVAKLIRT